MPARKKRTDKTLPRLEDWMTIPEAAEKLGISQRTIRRQLAAGQFKTVRKGFMHLIPAPEIKNIKIRPAHRPKLSS